MTSDIFLSLGAEKSSFLKMRKSVLDEFLLQRKEGRFFLQAVKIQEDQTNKLIGQDYY